MTTPHEPSSHTGPCADELHVYLPYSRTEMLRFNRARRRWDEPLPTAGKVCSGPIVAGPFVLYGTNRSTLHAVDRKRLQPRWTFVLEGEPDFVWSRPAARDGRVFVGGPDGSGYCLDLESGDLLWKAEGRVPSRARRVVGKDAVFLLTSTGCYALSVESGETLWSYAAECEPATCSPAVGGGRMIRRLG